MGSTVPGGVGGAANHGDKLSARQVVRHGNSKNAKSIHATSEVQCHFRSANLLRFDVLEVTG